MDILESPPTCRACGEVLNIDSGFCQICGRLFCGRHLTLRKQGVSTCEDCEPDRLQRESDDGLAADEDRLVRLLSQDLLATVGPGYEVLAIEEAAGVRLFAETTRDYELRVVDELQQRVHDEFIDTSWPACPLHHNHPLWYSEGWWSCPQAGAIARLGELGSRQR